jgi:hypothetical protein
VSNELSPWLPAALGLAVGVFVWAILCAVARRKQYVAKRLASKSECKKCPRCGNTRTDGCLQFPRHEHAWCGCYGGFLR